MGVVIVLGLGLVAPPPEAAGDSAEVCTIGGLSVPDGAPTPTDVPLVMSCFETLAEAEEFVEAGAPGDLEQLIPRARGGATLSTVIVGKQYTGTSRSGAVLVQWGTGSGCYGVTYGYPSMPFGWNDEVRSSEGFSNCWVSNYTATSYGGSSPELHAILLIDGLICGGDFLGCLPTLRDIRLIRMKSEN